MSKLNRLTLPALPASFEQPGFHVERVTHGIVHIGIGGFHRAHMARYTHDLMGRDEDALQWGITGVGLRASDRPLLNALLTQDGLYSLTEREGQTQRRALVASVLGGLDASQSTETLLALIEDERTKIVSMTVTEAGYCLNRATKQLDLHNELIIADLADPERPRSVPGILVEAYRRRRRTGGPAFTALSCDNIQHNGNVLKAAVRALAARQDKGLADWIEANAGFPNSMVDRITPVPTAADIAAFAAETGIEDQAALASELFRQWVIEDKFTAGRPAWEKAGVQFVEDVAPYELMKLRLLNGSHLAVAALGQMMGYVLIGEAIGDPLLHRYMSALMDRETGPTLMPVAGIDLAGYKQDLLGRFANPAIRDTTQRVNTDAPVNVLIDPIRDRLSKGQPIGLLALGLAAWLRRTRGTGEDGQPIHVVHPQAELLAQKAQEGESDPTPLLSIASIFGDIGHDRRLASAVGGWLASIYARGVRATVASAAADGLF